MSARRLVLVLVTLLLSAAPVRAQTSPPDSVTLSEESIRNFQTALEEAQTSLANLNRAAASGSQVSPGNTDGVDRTRIFNVLFLVLALSLVFESAMSVIFDWRLFIRYFEGRGVKTPLIVAVAFLVFLNYDLDIVAELLRGFPQISGTIGDTSLPGQLLTALLIAGGSSGVFRIFARLGIRSPEERDKKAQQERALMEEAADTESSDTNS